MIAKGQQIADFVIESEGDIGNGNFSTVFRAVNINDNKEVALKVCKLDASADDLERFKKENDILHKLKPHERIIEPYTEILTGGSFYCYAMELAYCNLSKYLRENFKLTFEEKIQLFRKICEGVNHSHDKSVVHRDLWWNNVLLIDSGGDNLKLCDFGRAKDFDSSEEDAKYSPQTVGGLNVIWPPENNFRIWDKAELEKYVFADMYALGIMLHFIFKNVPIFYFHVVQGKIQEFLIAKGVTSGAEFYVLSADDRKKLYDEWQAGFDLDLLKSHLSISIPQSQEKEQKINEIIFKLSHPGYKNRYENVELLIADLDKV